MELWIRSQDKETLIKIDYLYLDGTNKNVIIGYCQSTFTSPKLGTYKSKERALEVLDEIQNKLKPTFITHEPIKYGERRETIDTTPPIKVYEMPEE